MFLLWTDEAKNTLSSCLTDYRRPEEIMIIRVIWKVRGVWESINSQANENHGHQSKAFRNLRAITNTTQLGS